MSQILEEKRKTVAALRAELENLRRDCNELLQFRISGVTLRELREEIGALKDKSALARHNNSYLSDADQARLNSLLKIPEVLLFNSMRDKEAALVRKYEAALKHLYDLEEVSESSLEEKRKAVATLRAEYERWGEDIKKYLETQISGMTLREIREEITSLRYKGGAARDRNLAPSSTDQARLGALIKIPEVSVYRRMLGEESSVMIKYYDSVYHLKELDAVWSHQAPQSPPKLEDVAVLDELAGPHLTDLNVGGQLASNVNDGFADGLSFKFLTDVTLRHKPNERHCPENPGTDVGREALARVDDFKTE